MTLLTLDPFAAFLVGLSFTIGALTPVGALALIGFAVLRPKRKS